MSTISPVGCNIYATQLSVSKLSSNKLSNKMQNDVSFKGIMKAPKTVNKQAVSLATTLLLSTLAMFRIIKKDDGVEALSDIKKRMAAFFHGVTYESYTSDGAKVSRKLVNEADFLARKSVKYYVKDNWNVDPQRVDEIKAQRDRIISNLHEGAKKLPNDMLLDRGVEEEFMCDPRYFIKVKHKGFSEDMQGWWDHPWISLDQNPQKALDNLEEASLKTAQAQNEITKGASEVLNSVNDRASRTIDFFDKLYEVKRYVQLRPKIKKAANYLGENPNIYIDAEKARLKEVRRLNKQARDIVKF